MGCIQNIGQVINHGICVDKYGCQSKADNEIIIPIPAVYIHCLYIDDGKFY